MAVFAVRFAELLLNSAGRPVTNAPYQLLLTGTETPATVYSDRSKTPFTGQLVTNSYGNASGWVDPGYYDIRIGDGIAQPMSYVAEDDADTVSPGDTLAQGPRGDKGDQGDPGPPGQQGVQGIPGPQGQQGIPGNDGASVPLGLNWKGTWSTATSYVVNDVVVYANFTWFAIASSLGHQPQEDAFWSRLPLMGVSGPQGIQGIPGEKGAQGEPGLQGLQGIQGITGDKGDKGDQGAPGPAIPMPTRTINDADAVAVSGETINYVCKFGIRTLTVSPQLPVDSEIVIMLSEVGTGKYLNVAFGSVRFGSASGPVGNYRMDVAPSAIHVRRYATHWGLISNVYVEPTSSTTAPSIGSNEWLRENIFNIRTTTRTYGNGSSSNPGGAVILAGIVWPDLTVGTYTAVTFANVPFDFQTAWHLGAVNEFTATYGTTKSVRVVLTRSAHTAEAFASTITVGDVAP